MSASAAAHLDATQSRWGVSEPRRALDALKSQLPGCGVVARAFLVGYERSRAGTAMLFGELARSEALEVERVDDPGLDVWRGGRQDGPLALEAALVCERFTDDDDVPVVPAAVEVRCVDIGTRNDGLYEFIEPRGIDHVGWQVAPAYDGSAWPSGA